MSFKKRKSSPSQSIFITGATGGIGRELAMNYAKQGARLVLWGRSEDKLQKIAGQCTRLGAGEIHTRQVDLCNVSQALDLFEQDMKDYFCDCVILSAGLSDTRGLHETLEDPREVLKTSLVNYSAAITLASAAAHAMMKRHVKGDIVLLGSVAAFYEIPFATAYSSSKAGLKFFADTARLAWRQLGISVMLISPGFVDTPMSRRLQRSRPFLVSAPKAAQGIMWAISRKKPHYIFPWPFRVLRIVERLLPEFIREKILLALKPG